MSSWILPMILFVAGFLTVFCAPMIYRRWKAWRDYRLALRMAEKLGRSLGLMVATDITKDFGKAMVEVARRVGVQGKIDVEAAYKQRTEAYEKASKLARKEENGTVH